MSDSLKIAHIDTEASWRGGEQQVFSLMEGLALHGHSNVAVVKKGSVLASRLKGARGLVSRLIEISPWGEWDLLAGVRLGAMLKKEGVHMAHAHTGHAVSLAALARKSFGLPFVVTRRVDFHLSKNMLSAWKYRQASHVIAISNKVRDVLLQDSIPSEKISVVRSGVDLKRFKTIKPIPKENLGLNPNGVVVGQVAALAPHKDQSTFLKAISHLRDRVPGLQVVIVGEGPLREELENLSSALELHYIVRFTGFREDSLSILKSFDVFCLSSKDEGLGTSILDAMALGVPVVATRAGGIPEMVMDGESGYLAPPQDPRALADVLYQAVVDVGSREQILNKARWMVSRFDITITVQETEKVYKAVLNIL